MRALDVLELDPDADFEGIRAAWRRLAKENHPDIRPGDTEAAKRFQAIQAAYEVLRTAEERRTWKKLFLGKTRLETPVYKRLALVVKLRREAT